MPKMASCPHSKTIRQNTNSEYQVVAEIEDGEVLPQASTVDQSMEAECHRPLDGSDKDGVLLTQSLSYIKSSISWRVVKRCVSAMKDLATHSKVESWNGKI